MYADLNMGGYKITNLADATLLNDVPKYGQIAGAMDWEFDTANTLRLLSNNNDVIATVVIPTAGGTGTVTSITAGAGLEGGVITLAGTISMPVLGVGQSYSGGISQIAIDDYGRVTSVTEGAFANTNLGNNPTPSNVEITSSTGSNTTIAAAIPSGNAGVMTGLMAQQLADLVSAGIGGGMIPPIEILGVDATPTAALGAAVRPWTEQHNTNVTNAGWTSVFEHIGSGLIEYMGIVQDSIAASGLIDLRLTIDGIVVWSANDVFDEGVTPDDSGISIIGYVDVTGQLPTVFQNVKFNTSIDLEALSNTSLISNLDGQVKWQKYT
jgi:hypothetical protein